MKKNQYITIDGTKYPCYQTMGAMVRFADLAGKDFSEFAGTLSETAMFLYCCVVSACAREKKEFTMEFMDFSDSIDVENMVEWQKALMEEAEAKTNSKKK